VKSHKRKPGKKGHTKGEGRVTGEGLRNKKDAIRMGDVTVLIEKGEKISIEQSKNPIKR